MTVARDALYFCSVNINIFSTVTLEAAYLDKPIVHIAFDAGPVSNRIPCREYYKFDHFRNIAESGASILVESYEELFAALRGSLQHPEERSTQRKALWLIISTAPPASPRRPWSNAFGNFMTREQRREFVTDVAERAAIRPSSVPLGKVLVTGASGFLGRRVLSMLGGPVRRRRSRWRRAANQHKPMHWFLWA